VRTPVHYFISVFSYFLPVECCVLHTSLASQAFIRYSVYIFTSCITTYPFTQAGDGDTVLLHIRVVKGSIFLVVLLDTSIISGSSINPLLLRCLSPANVVCQTCLCPAVVRSPLVT